MVRPVFPIERQEVLSEMEKRKTLEALCKELHAGKCPHFVDGVECEYPEEDCLDCDPVAVASRWLSPTCPRRWKHAGGRREYQARDFLAEVLKECRAGGE